VAGLLFAASGWVGGCAPSVEDREAPLANHGARPGILPLGNAAPDPPISDATPMPESLARIVRAVAGVPESPAKTPTELARLLLEGKEPEYRLYEVLPGAPKPWDATATLIAGRMQTDSRNPDGVSHFRWFRSEPQEQFGRVVVFEVKVSKDVRFPGDMATTEIRLEPGEHAALVRLAAALKGLQLQYRTHEKVPFSVALFGTAWYLLRVDRNGAILLDEETLRLWSSTPDPSVAVPSFLFEVLDRMARERKSVAHDVNDADREWVRECYSRSAAFDPDPDLRFRVKLLKKAYDTLFTTLRIPRPEPK
jgi:hypothetical protein